MDQRSALAWRSLLPIDAEFSRPFALDSLPPGGTAVVLKASAEECRALAARFDLVQLHALGGEVRIEPADAGTLVHVAGHLEADAVQSCVMTLEPVAAKVQADFDRLFSRALPAEARGEVEIDPEAELPEPLPHSGKLDLGEILAEELSLALDPYPKAPEADRLLAELQLGDRGEADRPFSVLASLRKH
jgi:uncharacterized metal-binding protein YceD (DUF177 family)